MYAVLLSSQTLYVLPFSGQDAVSSFLSSAWFTDFDRFGTPHLLLTSETRINTHRIDYKNSFSSKKILVVSGWKKWLHHVVQYDLSTSQIEYWQVVLDLVKSGTHRLKFSGDDENLTDDSRRARTQLWIEIESKYITQAVAAREKKLAVLDEALQAAGAYGTGSDYIQRDLARLCRRYNTLRIAEAVACYAIIDYVPVQYRGGHKI